MRHLVSVVLLAYGALLIGATYWQIVAAPGLLADARFNGYRLAIDVKDAARGRILDRTGLPLAFSEKSGDGYRRRYPDAATAHVTGYFSLRYGATGLEGAYDEWLSGARTIGLAGPWDRLLGRPRPVADVVTTIDLRLQRAADGALGDRRGAAVAIDPRNGEILALVSRPTFNADRVEGDFAAWRDDPAAPLFDRALNGLYPPGSTFKVVTYALGLAEGTVRADTIFRDPDNGIVVDRYRIADPNHPGVPAFDYQHALAYSSNSAFADLGTRLGRDTLVAGARRFGFETPIPFDVPTEPSHLQREGDFLSSRLGLATTAIGQGQLLASPLQMALVAATIAGGGEVPRPRLVRELRAGDGRTIKRTSPSTLGRAVSRAVAATVKDGMVLGVRESWAKTAALPNVIVAGKTGTAETDADANPHAWFIAFAPADAPRIAVAVVVEHAGGGSTYAGPIVRRMLDVGLQIVAP